MLLRLCIALTVLATPFLTWAASPPFSLPARADLFKIRSAIISTSRGNLAFELFPEEAPWHVANFKYLADTHFYRGLRFHLFYPNYIIQGGAPRGRPNEGPGYTLPPEFNTHKHEFGALGMARAYDFLNPGRRSNGSQFYIVLGDASNMDGSYTVFGRLVSGDAVLKSLKNGDTILDVKVFVAQTGGTDLQVAGPTPSNGITLSK